MNKNVKKWIVLIAAFAMAFGIMASCRRSDNEGTSGGAANQGAQTTTPTPTQADQGGTQTEDTQTDTSASDDIAATPLRDFNGRAFSIGDWWTNNDAEEEPPTTLREEQWRDYRDDVFDRYNFTMRQMSVGGWGEHMELYTTSVMAGDPVADIFIMSTSWAAQLMSQGLLYPINTVESVNLNQAKWNSSISDLFTGPDGSVYGITNALQLEPRMYVFWNKRLYADAGIDPETPYNLQASGEWTWEAFMDLAERLTRDLDGDGIDDVFGFVAFEVEAIGGFTLSNNAHFINRGTDGLFYNAMLEPNLIEALQFAKSIDERGFWARGPEGAEWDWFVTGFHDGHAAMIMREAYSTGSWATMDDDWGMVFPPQGPRADNLKTSFSENVYVLPFNTSASNAEDIMFAFNLFTEPLAYDLAHPDAWKDGGWGYERFRDTRAVDETLAMFHSGEPYLWFDFRNMVPGIDWGPVFEWGAILGDNTVQENIEAAKPVIDAAIDDVNSR